MREAQLCSEWQGDISCCLCLSSKYGWFWVSNVKVFQAAKG